jgi:hypothetical protein
MQPLHLVLRSLTATASLLFAAGIPVPVRPPFRHSLEEHAFAGPGRADRVPPFSETLESQNRLGAAVGPVPFDKHLAAQNRERRAASREAARRSACEPPPRIAKLASPEMPGSADKSRQPQRTDAVRKVESAYDPRARPQLGQLIDLMA